MSGRARGDRVAAALGLAGASLGLLAGLIELTVGPSVRDWVGDKQDTTRLGLTTTILSAGALAAATALRRSGAGAGGRRVALALGMLVPGLVCFTTVGRLWYVPGVALLAAGVLVLAGTRRREFAAAFTAQRWRTGLLVVCGACYVLLGAAAAGATGILGVLGGALIWAAARTAQHSRPAAWILLLAGAVPFAAATWWALITPLIAVLSLVIGAAVIRHAGDHVTAGPRPATGAQPIPPPGSSSG